MATIANSLTAVTSYIKERYLAKDPVEMAFRSFPTLALLPRDTSIAGNPWRVPFLTEDSQNRSSTGATAVAGTTKATLGAWSISVYQDYGTALFSLAEIKAMRNDTGSFVKQTALQMRSARNALLKSLAMKMYSAGDASIGVIGSISTNDIVLASVSDAINFAPGMILQVSATQTGGAVRSGTVTVAGVNLQTGTITCTGAVTSGIAAAAANDFIYQSGDYDAGFTGFAAYIPASAASISSLWGQTRTAYVERLAGSRLTNAGTATTLPADEAIQKLYSQIVRVSNDAPDLVLCSPAQWDQIARSQDGKRRVVDLETEYGFGFKAISMFGSKGELNVVADRFCPDTRIYLLNRDSWILGSMGEIAELDEQDGNMFLRQATDYNYQARWATFCNLACKDPSSNGVIAIAAPSI